MKFETLASVIACTAVVVHAQTAGSATTQGVPEESTSIPIPIFNPSTSGSVTPLPSSSITVSVITEPDVSISGTSISTIVTPSTSGSTSRPVSGTPSTSSPSESEPAETEDPGSALSAKSGFTGPILAIVGGLFAALL